MPLRVHRTRRARLDLIEIWAFIAADNPSAADRLLDRFDAVFNMLAERPKAGRARNELRADTRSFVVGSYVVFYRPSTNTIEIMRVLSGYVDVREDSFDPEA